MAAAFRFIVYEESAGIATVTLNRPDRLNAWNADMQQEFFDALGRANANADIRVIILTGAGRGFCAGADTQHLGSMAASDQPKPSPEGAMGRFGELLRMPKPVIAAVNGPAAGIGFSLAMYCDLRFASDEASFTTSFARLGLTAEHALGWMLPRLIGRAAAADLLFSARKVAAGEAHSLGLVNNVFPGGELSGAVAAYARNLVETVSPRSLRIIKRQLWEGTFQTFGEAIQSSRFEMETSLQSNDFREGIAALREKRRPDFPKLIDGA